jgi:hypothetical protein
VGWIRGKMLSNKKNVFWEALVIVIAIFLVGFFLGLLVEEASTNEASELLLDSEVKLVDAMALTFLSEKSEISCDTIISQNVNFANRIYEEAIELERIEFSQTLTDGLRFLHRKYDLLRTLLWMNNEGPIVRCDGYNLVVYLYELDNEDLDQGARQNVWSKLLFDIRLENENVLLLPIAADQNLTVLDSLREQFGVEDLPAVIVNNEHIFYDVESGDELRKVLR